jgi:ABC-type multidrug transport system ATPase subunit
VSTDRSLDCLAELAGVSKRFGKMVALDGLDLQIRRGELVAVLGPNGAGKTTAISLFLGLAQPDAGSVSLFGRSPLLVDTRRDVGVMMQEVHLAPELRVREQIDLVASYYPDPLTPAAAMEATHTTSLAERPYGKLSGGQKRQAQFAMAICGRPRLLFLDEPTVGLDLRARELMWATLRKLVAGGASIVLTTHYLEEAEALADRVVVLARGRVVASGTVDDIRSLVTRKHVTCSTTADIDLVRTWPGVDSVNRDQARLLITATDAEAVVRRLMALDPTLMDLEVRRAGLAEAFGELTQEVA